MVNLIRIVFEVLVIELEGGEVGYVFSLGMVVIIVVMMLFNSGDYVVLIDDVYGGIYCVMIKVLNCFGIELIFVDISCREEVEKVICLNIKVIYIEILINLLFKIIDLVFMVDIVKKEGVLFIVDNIFNIFYF